LDTGVLELEERRSFLCRLTPDRALLSVEEAHDFLRERGLLTRTADSALPSLFAACHEEPYKPGGRGFGSWPRTKYPWYFELARRSDVHELRVHRGKSILFTSETLALVDPLCRAELARNEHDLLVRHLAAAGPSTLDDLQIELDLAPKELRTLRARLERVGAVVSREVHVELGGGRHRHTSELQRYDQAHPEPAVRRGGIEPLLVAAVQASVVAPELEVARWFSWPVEAEVVERLVRVGRLSRPAPGWVSAPASSSHESSAGSADRA
jgi:hypothetical protein